MDNKIIETFQFFTLKKMLLYILKLPDARAPLAFALLQCCVAYVTVRRQSTKYQISDVI